MAVPGAAAAIEGPPAGQGRLGLSRPRKVSLALGPLLFAAVALLPTPPAAAAAAAAVGAAPWAPQAALGMLLWMLVWWVGEAVPLGVAGLVVPLVFGLTAIVPWRDALASFSDPIVWIFIAGFVMAAAFQKWGLNQRVSITMALAYKGDDPRVAALFVAALPAFLLTLTGSITASASIVLPFASAYLLRLGLKPGSRYAEGTMLALGQAATAGALFLLISTPVNLVTKASIQTFAPGRTLTFGDWLIVGTPFAFLGLAISWFVTFRVLRPEMRALKVDRAQLESDKAALGPLSGGEKAVIALLALAIALWTVPSLARTLGEADPALAPLSRELAEHLPEAMPAVLVIVLAAVVRVRGEPLLRFPELVRGVDWNIVFLFGGGIALGVGLERSGFALWLAGGAAGLLGAAPSGWLVFAVCALIGFALSYAASNTAAALVACPIAATIALGAGLSPVAPILAAGIAASISSALPSTTPPMAIVQSSGFVRVRSMLKVGLVSDGLRLAALILLGPPLVSLLG